MTVATNTPPSNRHLRTRLCVCGWRTTCDTARTDATCACCGDPLPATTATTTGGAR